MGAFKPAVDSKPRPTLTLVLGKLRADARSFSPFSERAAEFAQILQHAKGAGVTIRDLNLWPERKCLLMVTLILILPPEPFPGFGLDQVSEAD
jgi:DNA-binding sugar fermentation-stimulating protein